MSLIIAPQLFEMIGKLTAKEQARVIEFINKFQANTAHPSVSLERLTGATSHNVWSGRVTQDIRAILFKDGDTWAMLHVDHHDPAYDWAERRTIGRHSVTGAIEIVESVETVREVERTIEVLVTAGAPPLFDAHDDAYLLSLGLSETWLPAVRKIADEDQLLIVCEKLPPDVGERLLSLAAGEFVTPPAPISPDTPALTSQDTRRRFYVVEDSDELLAALAAPMDRWIAFLHPTQRGLVDREFSGPSKVSGAAGTGKTVVAMHRAKHLASKGKRVLLTSYVSTLCENVERNLAKLCTADELDRITVATVHSLALRIVRSVEPAARPADDKETKSLLDTYRLRYAPDYDKNFVVAEWEHVIRAQGIESWGDYRGAARTGRGQGLSVKERKRLWQVFEEVLGSLRQVKRYDWSGLCGRAEELLAAGQVRRMFDAVIVDEVQDLKPPELRFLSKLCADNPGNLMLCGDAGQRIYAGGFSLRRLGIDVTGRSTILRINYRTTEQIRRAADQVLGTVRDDMDEGKENARTRSLLRGPQPELAGLATLDDELGHACGQIADWIKSGLAPEAIAVFARTSKVLEKLETRLAEVGIASDRLSDNTPPKAGTVRLGTMHRAKGLEFKAVLALDCSSDVLPHPAAISNEDDSKDREDARERERRLLYVALTRARDELAVTWNGTPSEFLAPLIATES